jgi:HEAT repeat protein
MNMKARFIALAVASAAFIRPATSQSIATRVSAARDGAVSFHFTARPGVCGDGESFVRTGKHQYHGSWATHYGKEPCINGPVQVRMTLEDGAVLRMQYWVGPVRNRAARDLGAVPAEEAARFLLGIASRGPSRVSAKAIMPAVLADSAEVWPALLAIAKDDFRSRDTRNDAVFWLSRFAGGALAGRPNEPFLDDSEGLSEDDELKRHALFVLSQLRNGEGVPELLQVARSNQNWRIRSQALFWLGQSGDRRVVSILESILRS